MMASISGKETAALMKKPWITAAAPALLAIAASAYLAVFLEIQYEFILQTQVGFLWANAGRAVFARCGSLFVCGLALFWVLSRFGKSAFHLIFRFRYAIALVVLLACVALELSGSSIGWWGELLNADTGKIFGSYRPIRSDEWLAFTPLALAQDQAGYPLVSEIVRGDSTVMTVVYGQPAWAITTLFRPFFWGYLLLGAAKGLSFFWAARLLALFLVTFECARLYTNDNKYLSAAVAAALAFAPVVQWWFAINGIVELFVFGQLFVLGLYRFLRVASFKKKLAFALLMAWSLGCYAVVLYPAWQVPLAYVFLAMSVWVLLEAHAETKPVVPRRYSAIALAIAAVFFIAGMAAFCFEGWDAISATLNTVYPGSRSEAGGNGLSLLFHHAFSLLLPVVDFTTSNQCEYAALYSLFPLGTLLGMFAAFKFRDRFSICLLVVQLFFLIYACIGFPEFLAKLTLLSSVAAKRLMLGIGFVETMLVVRFVAVWLKRRNEGKAGSKCCWAVAALVLAGSAVGFLGCLYSPDVEIGGFFLKMGLFAYVLVITAVFLALFAPMTSPKVICAYRVVPLLTVAFVIGVAGVFVNPIQQGLGALVNSEQAKSVHEVANSDEVSAKWLAIGDVYSSQMLIANGAPTINSLNVYPDMARWASIDKTGEYSDFYNRYAHIDVRLQNDASTWFDLAGADTLIVHLNTADMQTLGVGYIYSVSDLSAYETDSFALEVIDSGDGWYIYKVLYR